MFLNCLADCLVGGINAEGLVQAVENVYTHLGDVCVDGVVNYLEGDVAMGDKELFLVVHVEDLKVFHCTVHHGASVNADHGVEELVTALYAAFNKRSCVLASVVGHVVGGDIQGAGVGCAQTHGETVAQVEKDLGNMIASIAHADFAVCLCLLYQFVVGILKKAFEVDQMFKIFQMLHLFFKEFLFFGVLPLLR